MPSLVIDIDRDAVAQRFDVDLDGAEVTLELRYAERTSSWYCTVRDADTQEVIQGSKRLAANYPLVFVEDDRLPPGRLIVVSGASPAAPVRLRDLGDVAFLWYQSPDDFVPPPTTTFLTGDVTEVGS